MLIAFAGKGGTGKSTLAALTAALLRAKKSGSLLVIDADHNATLPGLLGVPVEATLADIKECVRDGRGPTAGMSRPERLEYELQRTLIEADGFDLLVMGNPEGPGCYCAVNALLTDALARLRKNYAYVVVDCAAGLEHFSRRLLRQIDRLVAVAIPSSKSVATAVGIVTLARELKLEVGGATLVVNRLPPGQRFAPAAATAAALRDAGLWPPFELPEDAAVAAAENAGASFITGSAGWPLTRAWEGILSGLVPAASP